MNKAGYAIYNKNTNELEVTRPGETIQRKIRCTNMNPSSWRVHGVQVQGDEIWVLVGPYGNPRPNRKFIYKFSSLSGGSSGAL